jgi:two-component system chemotaxis response regulator CheB
MGLPPVPGRSGDFRLTAIAASTGGPDALACLLGALDPGHPHPIVVVQHMPPGFTPLLAESLDARCPLPVTEASEGSVLEGGHVYLAPGGVDLLLRPGDGGPVVDLDTSPSLHEVRPSADALFRSLARHAPVPGAALAVILTGMGSDGRDGIRLLKRHGSCHCLVQDEASCVVHGMPRAVAEAGLADEVLPLNRMAGRINALVARSPAPR